MWWFWVITCDNLDLTVEYQRHAMLSDVVGYHRCNLKFSNQGRKAQIPSHCQCYVQQGSAGLRTRRAIWFLWQWNMGAIHGDQKNHGQTRLWSSERNWFSPTFSIKPLPVVPALWWSNMAKEHPLRPRPELPHSTTKAAPDTENSCCADKATYLYLTSCVFTVRTYI